MCLHKLGGEVEPETIGGDIDLSRPNGAAKLSEQFRERLLRDADSRVGNGKHHFPVLLFEHSGNRARRRVFNRVVYEVVEYLFEFVRVALHGKRLVSGGGTRERESFLFCR